jgi:ElaA protein
VTAPLLLRAPWRDLTTTQLYGILKLRTDVFYVEQKVDEEELDWRDAEPATVHHWAEIDGTVVAYLRVLTDARPQHLDAARVIGRVVTHPAHRGQGLAGLLIERAIDENAPESMMLHAQSYVVPLYERYGFEAYGEEYPEAGILHRSMYRPGRAPIGGR